MAAKKKRKTKKIRKGTAASRRRAALKSALNRRRNKLHPELRFDPKTKDVGAEFARIRAVERDLMDKGLFTVDLTMESVNNRAKKKKRNKRK